MNPLMEALAKAAISVAAPLFAQWLAQHNTAGTPVPMDPAAIEAGLLVTLYSNIDKGLAVGQAWTDAHSGPPKDTP